MLILKMSSLLAVIAKYDVVISESGGLCYALLEESMNTRMHSSRMHTVRCCGRLGREGDWLVEVGCVCPGGVYLGGLSAGGSARGIHPPWGPEADIPSPTKTRGRHPLDQSQTPRSPVHAGTHPLLPPWTEYLTHACENITFTQLLLRTVKIALWKNVRADDGTAKLAITASNVGEIICN